MQYALNTYCIVLHRIRQYSRNIPDAPCNSSCAMGAERNNGLAGKIIFFEKTENRHRSAAPPVRESQIRLRYHNGEQIPTRPFLNLGRHPRRVSGHKYTGRDGGVHPVIISPVPHRLIMGKRSVNGCIYVLHLRIIRPCKIGSLPLCPAHAVREQTRQILHRNVLRPVPFGSFAP